MISVTVPRSTTQPMIPKPKRRKRLFTPHPGWIQDMIQEVQPHLRAVQECALIQEVSTGALPLEQVRGCLIQLYPFVETFPQWLALNIAKATDMTSREILIDNVRIEKWHAQQWIHMAEGFGISRPSLFHTPILPKVEAMTHFMWSVNLRGSIAESMSAMSYAIEGATQGIARSVLQGFPHYERRGWLSITKKASVWMKNHARYDETHPLEALEIIKRHAVETDRAAVTSAATRSLEYFLIALQECYRYYAPNQSTGSYGPMAAA